MAESAFDIDSGNVNVLLAAGFVWAGSQYLVSVIEL